MPRKKIATRFGFSASAFRLRLRVGCRLRRLRRAGLFAKRQTPRRLDRPAQMRRCVSRARRSVRAGGSKLGTSGPGLQALESSEVMTTTQVSSFTAALPIFSCPTPGPPDRSPFLFRICWVKRSQAKSQQAATRTAARTARANSESTGGVGGLRLLASLIPTHHLLLRTAGLLFIPTQPGHPARLGFSTSSSENGPPALAWVGRAHQGRHRLLRGLARCPCPWWLVAVRSSTASDV